MALEKFHVSEDTTLTWLNGGVTHMDGGAMFGVVPRPLWTKKYPVNEKNQIELRTDPILIQMPDRNILLESGIGNGRLSEKAMRNYGVTEEAQLDKNLKELGLTRNDIDTVMMTHMHFDHACGLVLETEDGPAPAFPNAEIWTSQIEWEEMQHPNIRSRNTYFRENWEPVKHLVKTFSDSREIAPGIEMVHTGGHSAGHSIIHISRGDRDIWHMADIMPTHAHQNVLWVLAYDDYPMDSIEKKQKYITPALEREDWFLFYHDYKYRMLRWDKSGKEIAESLNRDTTSE
ncbi:YtnP family quorum-quenching lactonase [Alkalicoccus daliensis]|uniref:Glyoxylase, beta-lactamase superfamily II n=1 Tax=Alkalicoccus daliensis TaxID=745820 RepID=A0A1H0H3B6_9BACI|nr:MBL fold metallo-hydrolase [Alkalicoccus daliensis]SDO13580.1 Glyoxylase, beta-lactamase superfamily II [Alkalicoccus daliensis]